MDTQSAGFVPGEVWRLVERQHGVVARSQLLELGLTAQSIKQRTANGRLHPLWRGVYAVGRPRVGRKGRFTAALLACGDGAMLARRSAAELWGLLSSRASLIDVFVPRHLTRRRPGIRATPRVVDRYHVTRHRGIPVTSPARTLLDLATTTTPERLERAIDEADRLDLIDPERLRGELEGFAGLRGAPALRAALDRHTYVLTRSALERRLLPIARRAGLPRPRAQARLNGFLVDFYWPELGLVVETDGLRYHRTAAQQSRDLRRDQAHRAAGLLPLRFSHAQIAFERPWVERVLRDAVARRA